MCCGSATHNACMGRVVRRHSKVVSKIVIMTFCLHDFHRFSFVLIDACTHA